MLPEPRASHPPLADLDPSADRARPVVAPMNTSQVAATVLIGVLALWTLLFGWVNYNTWLMWLSWRLRHDGPKRPPLPARLPRVTVQLPVYNEESVIER